MKIETPSPCTILKFPSPYGEEHVDRLPKNRNVSTEQFLKETGRVADLCSLMASLPEEMRDRFIAAARLLVEKFAKQRRPPPAPEPLGPKRRPFGLGDGA